MGVEFVCQVETGILEKKLRVLVGIKGTLVNVMSIVCNDSRAIPFQLLTQPTIAR